MSIFTHGSNSSDEFLYNITEVQIPFAMEIITILLNFPTNSYVIWLIVTGTGNGLAAEFFSLNLSICEMVFCMECLLSFFKYKWKMSPLFVYFLDGFAITGRPLFQCLICVERYLAVVHPVIFLKSKPLRYRLICCVFVWAAGFVSCWVSVSAFLFKIFIYFILVFAQFFFFFSIQLFCLVAVLRALKQSGPGDRRREEENNMKRRAFHLILVSTVTMLVLYVPYVTLLTPQWMTARIVYINTLTSISFVSFALAGVVQPLLFLYRVGTLPFMKWQ